MKPTTLLLLLVSLLVGCNSLGFDDYRRSRRADSRGYDQRRADRAYPAWARVSDRGRTAYVLCHKNNKTKVVRTNAVRGHLRHGDRFGSCRADRRYDRRDRRYDNRRGRRGYEDRRGRRGYDDRRRHDGDDDDDGYRRRHDGDDDDD